MFGTDLETEITLEKPVWTERAVAASVGGDRAILFAASSETVKGMVGVYVADDSNHATLWGMWVAPELRGSGTAESLLSAVEAWTTASGLDRVQLCYYDHKTTAAKFYTRRGCFATDFVGLGAVAECEQEINVAKTLVAGELGADTPSRADMLPTERHLGYDQVTRMTVAEAPPND